jgi:PTH1 family peptidyl-tRNA hydrolase
MDIKAIIGLGNPGYKYRLTRHNIGFLILDQISDKYNLTWDKKDNLQFTILNLNNRSIYLIKPETFMNNSGEIAPFLKKYNIKSDNILVIQDELDFPFGKIGIKFQGSARGHNGIKSLISTITDKFYRLRFGISRPESKDDVSNYVLSNFENIEELNRYIKIAIEKIENIIKKE